VSNSKNHITTLTPELIEQYLKGDLSNAEMHEVEKLMLNSDFEAEAMEGFEEAGTEHIKDDLSSLEDRLLVRTQQKERTFPFYLKIAASLIILAVSTFLVIELVKDPVENNQLTQADEPQEESVPTPPVAEEEIETEDTEVIEETSDEQSLTETTTDLKDDNIAMLEEKQFDEQAATEPADIATKEESLPSPSPVEVENEVIEPEVKREVAMTEMPIEEFAEEDALMADKAFEKEEKVSRSRMAKAKKGAPASAQVRSTAPDNVITGTVKSAEDGTPLPGVNVIVEGTTTGTVTDIDGSYRINLPYDADSTLVFSFIGLAGQSVDLKGKSILDVEMDSEVQQLSEVVVTGYGAEADEEVADDYYAASPKDGWTEYRKYLEENVQYPKGQTEKGRVVVKFKVTPNGNMTEFEVVRSMGDSFDQEALRLIKNGPQWTPAKRGDQPLDDTVRIKVKFDPKD